MQALLPFHFIHPLLQVLPDHQVKTRPAFCPFTKPWTALGLLYSSIINDMYGVSSALEALKSGEGDSGCGLKGMSSQPASDWEPPRARLLSSLNLSILNWKMRFSIPTKCVVVSTSGEVHPQCQAIRRGHSLPRLSSKEVKMTTSTLSCGFDVCYVSNMVV